MCLLLFFAEGEGNKDDHQLATTSTDKHTIDLLAIYCEVCEVHSHKDAFYLCPLFELSYSKVKMSMLCELMLMLLLMLLML